MTGAFWPIRKKTAAILIRCHEVYEFLLNTICGNNLDIFCHAQVARYVVSLGASLCRVWRIGKNIEKKKTCWEALFMWKGRAELQMAYFEYTSVADVWGENVILVFEEGSKSQKRLQQRKIFACQVAIHFILHRGSEQDTFWTLPLRFASLDGELDLKLLVLRSFSFAGVDRPMYLRQSEAVLFSQLLSNCSSVYLLKTIWRYAALIPLLDLCSLSAVGAYGFPDWSMLGNNFCAARNLIYALQKGVLDCKQHSASAEKNLSIIS